MPIHAPTPSHGRAGMGDDGEETAPGVAGFETLP
jgi:hypothetical protein